MSEPAPRHIAWFSCGAASAVAAKLMLADHPDTIVARRVVSNEHQDNDRFAADAAKWLGVTVVELRSRKYEDAWEVWKKRRYLNGPAGALCTVEMKKRVRQEFEDLTDIQAFGYTSEEQGRADRFRQNNNVGLTKADCFRIIMAAGLALPEMYRLGYNNSNCVGCVKGGMGYWNKIRRDFPAVFERMAALEEDIGASCIRGNPLRALSPSAGRSDDLRLPDCGLFCGEGE